MTPQELIARAEDLLAAWNHRDVDQIVAAFSPEVRLHGLQRSRGGRGAVRTHAERRLREAPDLRLEAVRTLAIGSIVVQEWIDRGSRRGAGVTVADYDLSGRITAIARYASGS
jgi:hypothetical protein